MPEPLTTLRRLLIDSERPDLAAAVEWKDGEFVFPTSISDDEREAIDLIINYFVANVAR